jgi:erythromycin esterase
LKHELNGVRIGSVHWGWARLVLAAALAVGCGGSAAAPDPDQNSTWIQQRAVPFDTDDPAAASTDLQAFKTMVGAARVVMLGEGTHGTAEFFRMKHRLLRLLVEEAGFTAFGIEASFPDSEPINEYVLHGHGDSRRVLAGQGFWTWRTEEVLAMVEWMREYNRLHGPVLSFRGFDMQRPITSMDAVVDYLRRVDRSAATSAGELYAVYRPYADSQTTSGYRAAPAETRTQSHANVAEVAAMLDLERDRYEAASSARAYADARQHARVVVQAESLYGAAGNRDAFMAENALWLADQAGPGARVVLWAHNGHVLRSADGFRSMGSVLDRQLGAQLLVVGFAFGQGACTAAGGGRLGTHAVPPPVAGSYEATFSRSGLRRFLLDTRGLVPGSPGPDWFLRGQLHRSIGAVYETSRADQYFFQAHPQRLYDVVVYFEDTTASRVYTP